MKESAVDYLRFQFKALLLAEDALMKENKFFKTLDSIIEQAKQMEKEQILDAFNNGMNHSVDYFIPEDDIIEAIEYYNKTYKHEAQTRS